MIIQLDSGNFPTFVNLYLIYVFTGLLPVYIHNFPLLFHRKRYTARQAIIHSYGDFEEDNDDDDSGRVDGRDPKELEPEIENEVMVSMSFPPAKKPCKCGSTTHSRTSHKQCPMRKK